MNWQFHFESNRLHLGQEVEGISQAICASLDRSSPGERKCREAPKAAKEFPSQFAFISCKEVRSEWEFEFGSL
ncbi:hypothetical protein CEXT_604751 [Caerostris extrusa]|uniref:Uncharacterized protein n=1 Tax=Caerostris extrusa TaxID=172846 RepID=A0AAV4TXG4_CAEEX|nr:hypothetical protein CEXT_604751 [Caerostris extrusa]